MPKLPVVLYRTLYRLCQDFDRHRTSRLFLRNPVLTKEDGLAQKWSTIVQNSMRQVFPSASGQVYYHPCRASLVEELRCAFRANLSWDQGIPPYDDAFRIMRALTKARRKADSSNVLPLKSECSESMLSSPQGSHLRDAVEEIERIISSCKSLDLRVGELDSPDRRVGTLLVAHPAIGPPFCRRLVLLCGPYWGLVLNSSNASGGPVGCQVSALLTNVNAMDRVGMPVTSDRRVQVSRDRGSIDRAVSSGKVQDDDICWLTGRAQWYRGQLESEVESGAWICVSPGNVPSTLIQSLCKANTIVGRPKRASSLSPYHDQVKVKKHVVASVLSTTVWSSVLGLSGSFDRQSNTDYTSWGKVYQHLTIGRALGRAYSNK